MFNFLSHLSLYWHLQKCRSRRALPLRSWRLGAQQRRVGALPIALPIVSFNFNYLLLQRLLGKLGWNLASATGMGTKPSAGPGCSGVKNLSALPVGWFCQSLTIPCGEPFANPELGRGWCLEQAGKSSLSCWDGTVCLSWGCLECDVVVAEGERHQRSGWEAERSCGDAGWEGQWCRRAEQGEEEVSGEGWGTCPRGLGGGQEVWAEEMVKCSAPQWECWRDPLCLLG